MLRFADRTGLTSRRPPHRYLWTDAFAVCNLLELARATDDERHRELALVLIDQVHHELGRHREDDPLRSGWLSGLSHQAGAAHPTCAGLRIGKALPERRPGERFDPRLEWDRDGQYFHYLTKWMHALDQAARSTSGPALHLWARELADVAHRAFTYGPPGQRRMAWKLSVDLSRSLVASMGEHDPLDGLVTCTELDATSTELGLPKTPDLEAAASDYERMIDPRSLATSDPLGLGGLLFDAFRLAQTKAHQSLLAHLLEASALGLSGYLATPGLRAPAQHRLGFRELGLAIGLAALPMLEQTADALDSRARDDLLELAAYAPLRTEIESFWLDGDHQRSPTWTGHLDINEVMLATSLLPGGFLRLSPSPTEARQVQRGEPRLRRGAVTGS